MALDTRHATSKRLVTIALVADDELMGKLVLKGGNVIRIAHEVGNRGAADLDFLMAEDFEDLQATFATIWTPKGYKSYFSTK